jgi:hypothetical protein
MSERAREQIELDDVLRTPSGRAVLLRILEKTGYFDSTFNKDPIQMAGFSAKREVGTWLVDEMSSANNGQFINIMKEKYNG